MNKRLTLEQARQIRTRYTTGPNRPSIRKLAKEYQVSKSLIWRILHNEIYREETAK